MADSAVSAVLPIVFIFVRVTGDTLVWRALINSVSVTGTACKLRMMPDQWEACIVVIEGYVCPSAGIMTRATVRAKLTTVLVHRGMACVTICGSSLVHTVCMAGCTLDSRMHPR